MFTMLMPQGERKNSFQSGLKVEILILGCNSARPKLGIEL